MFFCFCISQPILCYSGFRLFFNLLRACLSYRRGGLGNLTPWKRVRHHFRPIWRAHTVGVDSHTDYRRVAISPSPGAPPAVEICQTPSSPPALPVQATKGQRETIRFHHHPLPQIALIHSSNSSPLQNGLHVALPSRRWSSHPRSPGSWPDTLL